MIFVKDAIREGLEDSLIASIELAEVIAGFEFEITSGVRDDASAHGVGLAVDIRCSTSKKRLIIIGALTVTGIVRIGVYDRHIHADRDSTRVPNVLWIGESK